MAAHLTPPLISSRTLAYSIFLPVNSTGRLVKFDHVAVMIRYAETDVVDASDFLHGGSFTSNWCRIYFFASVKQRQVQHLFSSGLALLVRRVFIPAVRRDTYKPELTPAVCWRRTLTHRLERNHRRKQ